MIERSCPSFYSSYLGNTIFWPETVTDVMLYLHTTCPTAKSKRSFKSSFLLFLQCSKLFRFVSLKTWNQNKVRFFVYDFDIICDLCDVWGTRAYIITRGIIAGSHSGQRARVASVGGLTTILSVSHFSVGQRLKHFLICTHFLSFSKVEPGRLLLQWIPVQEESRPFSRSKQHHVCFQQVQNLTTGG